MKKPIFAVFGEPGSGRKTLVQAALEALNDELAFLPTFTTLPADATDLPYFFVREDEAALLVHEENFFIRREGTYHFYTTQPETDRTLETKMGILVLGEEAVRRLVKKKGYQIIPIYIQPQDRTLTPQESKRVRAAETMEKPRRMKAKKTIINSFKKGGRERAVKRLVEYIRGYAI